MRVLVAMSGGVDSSVAAAWLVSDGHEVVGATLKLWGGAGDSGCCSVGDVEDARRVAGQLGIDHHVFNFSDLFEHHVVDPYVEGHARGLTPNPCIECNRHVKFGVLLERARRLGFDALATGHHARIERGRGRARLRRGVDYSKDQSYVLSMLRGPDLDELLLPVGEKTKDDVRAAAAALGLATAAKPDSQDVCFIHSATGRGGFLGERITLHPGVLVDAATGQEVGTVPSTELVTVGQRRGLGLGIDGRRRFALSVDPVHHRVVVGDAAAARTDSLALNDHTWLWESLPYGSSVLVQASAHGRPVPARLEAPGLRFAEPQRLVSPGQTVAFYDASDPEVVVGSAIVASS
ncbi:MAG: tRNA 2-thiouridine(34) synthase MnmA [Acidimicrobiales bacterium]